MHNNKIVDTKIKCDLCNIKRCYFNATAITNLTFFIICCCCFQKKYPPQ